MPRPRLLKPALLVVDKLERATTPQDAPAREPMGDSQRTRFEILAQRTNVHRQMPQFEQWVVNEQVRGWFTVLIEDAKRIGYDPARGDRIVAFGDDWSTELYVVNYEPIGHWRGGTTMLRLYFADRRPASAVPDRTGAQWS